ncbi:uncharacterized protein AMSG_09298 [Thecamonas trahens ATCC 50062]|uniref:Fibronectin type III domain-containing protein n=1 Tax=Thecamonas trahens ATCC 50062 TaxID=461836 RepID=A0A0L0DLM7_THETB|nr:hypothetical protein AMSG_09298 [Thecamonas trahens ATCC 50062]KNC53212.1 hypothetical protein AMSG_09298 [Thecamonas trahens ATCC 50062]|eukprot:XP_013754681.1 hypothetical protein AMSG_09298 [Thecamonas trahens ATCC 50062]
MAVGVSCLIGLVVAREVPSCTSPEPSACLDSAPFFPLASNVENHVVALLTTSQLMMANISSTLPHQCFHHATLSLASPLSSSSSASLFFVNAELNGNAFIDEFVAVVWSPAFDIQHAASFSTLMASTSPAVPALSVMHSAEMIGKFLLVAADVAGSAKLLVYARSSGFSALDYEITAAPVSASGSLCVSSAPDRSALVLAIADGASLSAFIWRPASPASLASFPLPAAYTAPLGAELTSCAIGDVQGSGDLALVAGFASVGALVVLPPSAAATAYNVFADTLPAALIGMNQVSLAWMPSTSSDAIFVGLPDSSRLVWAAPRASPALLHSFVNLPAAPTAVVARHSAAVHTFVAYSVVGSSTLRLASITAAGVTFAQPASAYTGLTASQAEDMALGYFDTDAHLDVAVAVGNSIVWLTNTGHATNTVSFALGGTVAAATKVADVVALDVDADGVDDIVASWDTGMSVYHNTNGDGSLWTASTLTTAYGVTVINMAVVDIDNDGAPDIVAGSRSPSELFWIRNDWVSSSAFAPLALITAPSAQVTGTAGGDINQDGTTDVVYVSKDDDRVAWVPHLDGAGSFGTAVTIATLNAVVDVAVGDFDADGDLDIAAAAAVGINANRVFWNTEVAGSFDPVPLVLASSGIKIHSVDLDADGDIDILTAGQTQFGTDAYISDGAGAFARTLAVYNLEVLAGGNIKETLAGDVTGDAVIDILSLDRSSGTVYGSRGVVVPRAITLADTLTDLTAPFSNVNHVAAADFNADNNTDLVMVADYSDDVYLVLNSGSGTLGALSLGAALATNYGIPRYVLACDVDLDGDADVVVVYNSPGEVVGYENDGTGGFGSERVLASGVSPQGAVLGDLDGDGDPDLVVGFDDSLELHRNADGGWSYVLLAVLDTALGHDVTALELADVNGDTYVDVVAGTNNAASFGLVWLPNTDGAASFGSRSIIEAAVNRNLDSIATGDVDSDGDVDIVAAVSDNRRLRLYRNVNGLGTFGAFEVLVEGLVTPRWISLVDIDADGDLDVAAVADGAATFFVQYNVEGLGGFSTPVYVDMSTPDLNHVVLLDFDGDAFVDFVTVSRANGGSDKSDLRVYSSAPSLHPLVAETVAVTCTTVGCIETAIAAAPPCTHTRIELAPAAVIGCFPEHHHEVATKSVVVAAAVPGTVIIDCGAGTGVGLFHVTAGAHLVFDGLVIRGGNANALSIAPRQGLLRVSGRGSVLVLRNCVFDASVSGGAVGVEAGGALEAVDVVFADVRLAKLSGAARDAVPARQGAVEGGAVLRVSGAGSSATLTNVSMARCGPADDLYGAVGGAVLVEAAPGVSLRLVRDVVIADGAGLPFVGGAVAVVGANALADMTDLAVEVGGGMFARNRAVWGGALGVADSLAVLPPHQSGREYGSTSLVLDAAAPAGGASAHVAVDMTGAGLVSNSATYGGAVFVCGARVVGAPGTAAGNSAESGGGFGFVCHSPALGIGPLVAPASHPWLSAGANSNAIIDSRASYGEVWASGVASATVVKAVQAELMVGQSLNPSPQVEYRDVFGTPVVDERVAVVATAAVAPATAASDVALLAGTRTETLLSSPLAVFASTTASLLSREALDETPDLRLALSLGGTRLPAVTVGSVALAACGDGFGLDLDAANQIPAEYRCSTCATGTVSSETSLAVCTATFVCPEPSVLATPTLCLLCPKDTFFAADAFAAALANGTVTNSATASEASAYCGCVSGYWSPAGRDPTTPCVECPRGARCRAGLQQRPEALAGFFDMGSANGEPKFVECPRRKQCAGGRLGASCAAGATGRFCARCLDEWFPAPQGECVKCSASSLGAMVAVLVLVVGLVMAVIGVSLRKMGEVRAGGGEIRAEGEERGDVLLLRLDSRHPASRVPRALSALLLYLQVLDLLGKSDFNWPSSVDHAVGVASVGALDVGAFISTCDTGTFYTAYMIKALLPIGLGLLASCGLVGYGLGRGRLGESLATLQRVVITVGPLMYIPCAKAILTIFDCTKLPDGTYYLDADLAERCGSSEWVFAATGVGFPATVLFVVGLPAFIGSSLWRARQRLYTREVVGRLGSVYTAFRESFWWFEVALLGKRLVLVGVALFLSSLQIWLVGGLLAVFLGFAAIQLKHEPFFRPVHNTLEVRLNVALSFVLLFGFVFYADRFPNSGSRLVCEILLFSAIGLGLAAIAVAALAEVREARRARVSAAAFVGERDAESSRLRAWKRVSDAASEFVPPEQLEAWQAAVLHPDLGEETSVELGKFGSVPVFVDNDDSVGLDIGGTLTKIVIFTPAAHSSDVEAFVRSSDRYGETGKHDVHLQRAVPELGGSLFFVTFETCAMSGAIRLIEQSGLAGNDGQSEQNGRSGRSGRLGATGGGAHKYADAIRGTLGVDLGKMDEMQCLVAGMAFLLTSVGEEAYSLEFDRPERATAEATRAALLEFAVSRKSWEVPRSISGGAFPFLLVNIGSGVSVILAESFDTFSRVSGTALGGATFLGLAKLLLGVETFDEALDLAEQGDVTKVNMTVGDIYGGDYVGSDFVLPASLTASCFGKLVARAGTPAATDAAQHSRADLALALLVMISQNVAQVGFLNAQRLGMDRIFFTGNFLRHEPKRHTPIAQRTLAFYVALWSQGEMEALFMRHEGYCGAAGALVLEQ